MLLLRGAGGTATTDWCGTCDDDASNDCAVSLDFSGACGTELKGAASSTQIVELMAQLTTTGMSIGAQGWSISMGIEGGVATAISLEGTDARSICGSTCGYEISEVTTGENNQGAFSAVLLSMMEALVLPLNSTSTVAKLTVEFTIPDTGSKDVKVLFVDGMKGAGQPVINTVTIDGKSAPLSLGECTLTLTAE